VPIRTMRWRLTAWNVTNVPWRTVRVAARRWDMPGPSAGRRGGLAGRSARYAVTGEPIAAASVVPGTAGWNAGECTRKRGVKSSMRERVRTACLCASVCIWRSGYTGEGEEEPEFSATGCLHIASFDSSLSSSSASNALPVKVAWHQQTVVPAMPTGGTLASTLFSICGMGESGSNVAAYCPEARHSIGYPTRSSLDGWASRDREASSGRCGLFCLCFQ